MNRKLLAAELVKVAKLLAANTVVSIIDGKSKRQAVKIVNDLLYPLTKGMHRDEYWQGVKAIWDMLNKHGIEYVTTSADYRHNTDGVTQSKVWKFEIEFLDNKSKLQTLYGTVVASGAGSPQDILEVYDVTAYVG